MTEISDLKRRRLIKGASYASVLVALSLVALKTWGWQETDSVSLLSSLADSILDVFASGITFWAVRYSLSPADAEHRFGHGKSEGLAALFQSIIIAASGFYVVYKAINRAFDPQPLADAETGLAVMIIATAATVGLVGLQRYVGKRTNSVAISADAVHYQTDLIINLGVGLAIVLTSWTGYTLIDAIVGLLIALLILQSVYGIARRSLEILLDHEIPIKDREAIETIALTHPDVRGVHDMKTRFGGSHYIIQFHVELPSKISLLESHEILDSVEEKIRADFKGCDIIIHPDPAGIDEIRDDLEYT